MQQGLSGCRAMDEFLNMRPLEIESFSPSEKILHHTSVKSVSVSFSGEMNRSRAEDSFELSKNGTAVQGSFSWKGKTMIFTPFVPAEKNCSYRIEVSTDAEDKYGNSLPEKFIFTFSTSFEDTRPVFVSSNTGDRETVTDPFLPLSFVFSKPLDSESIYSSFSISPGVNGHLTTGTGGSEIIFMPLEKYTGGTDYTVTISEALKDLSGNCISGKQEIFFSMDETEGGTIAWFGDSDGNKYLDSSISAVNHEIEKDVTLRLILDSEASDKTRNAPVTVSPSIPFSKTWNSSFTECLITFDSPLVYDEIYEINSCGNIYRLLINGAGSKPPFLVKAVFCNDSSSPVFEELTLNRGINFQTSDTAFFDFYFTLADGAALTDTAIFTSAVFRTVNGDLSVSPLRVVNPADSSSPAPSPPPETGEYVFRIECSVTAGTRTSPFRIEFDTTLSDTLSNQLREKAVVQVTSL